MFEEPKNEQEKYRVGIIVALDNNIRVDGFKNSDVQHTIIIDEEFIKRAKSEVCILCNRLRQDVWCSEGVLNSLEIAKKAGVCVKLITREPIDGTKSGNEFFKKLQTFPDGKFFYQECQDISEASANILIIDKLHYCIEPNTVKKDGEPNRAAFAGIHCPDVASAWEEEFNKVCCL